MPCGFKRQQDLTSSRFDCFFRISESEPWYPDIEDMDVVVAERFGPKGEAALSGKGMGVGEVAPKPR